MPHAEHPDSPVAAAQKMRHLWPLVGCVERQRICDVELCAAVRLADVDEGLIPTGINQNPWAHFRRPIDMIFQG